MKLVVGLGNPGRKYEATRHNAGFWWVDRLAARERASLAPESRFQGNVGRIRGPGGDAWLLEPSTFMNLSGRAVQALAAFYRIAPVDILVVHDELDLPPGAAKLKLGGGHGGHNGLRDIEAQLGTREFWRLRLGIGHPRNTTLTEQQVIDYVLHPPGPDDARAIDEAIDRSLALWPLIVASELEAAMLKLHTRVSPAKAPPAKED
jgi:PTH1 family peptidyl-tRNA hydrolase